MPRGARGLPIGARRCQAVPGGSKGCKAGVTKVAMSCTHDCRPGQAGMPGGARGCKAGVTKEAMSYTHDYRLGEAGVAGDAGREERTAGI